MLTQLSGGRSLATAGPAGLGRCRAASLRQRASMRGAAVQGHPLRRAPAPPTVWWAAVPALLLQHVVTGGRWQPRDAPLLHQVDGYEDGPALCTWGKGHCCVLHEALQLRQQLAQQPLAALAVLPRPAPGAQTSRATRAAFSGEIGPAEPEMGVTQGCMQSCSAALRVGRGGGRSWEGASNWSGSWSGRAGAVWSWEGRHGGGEAMATAGGLGSVRPGGRPGAGTGEHLWSRARGVEWGGCEAGQGRAKGGRWGCSRQGCWRMIFQAFKGRPRLVGWCGWLHSSSCTRWF